MGDGGMLGVTLMTPGEWEALAEAEDVRTARSELESFVERITGLMAKHPGSTRLVAIPEDGRRFGTILFDLSQAAFDLKTLLAQYKATLRDLAVSRTAEINVRRTREALTQHNEEARRDNPMGLAVVDEECLIQAKGSSPPDVKMQVMEVDLPPQCPLIVKIIGT